ncbi:putative acrEF/envCD operon repressor [Pelotomaculum sp. FP]|uniref:TetR/AcrR family transcriptional regulator n=1 Tax=Pelotomaculum sp. FP TaxID=261474 RepID=UPI0010660551|nr:TetR/AcrR family transcriptional regulator [Pelotomaculum sp. FP]TEB14972.1 putative acrEF/envCD operon repressor [Pelotomaculum sp. FP]
MGDKKEDIFNAGKELFSARGFKDTNVSDITKMAGVGVGTFYNYYSSKEKLFLEIYLEENVKLKKSMMESIDLDADPLKVVKELMAFNIRGMKSNPILREWYNRDVFSKLEQHYREENGIKYVDFLYHNFAEVIKKWQVEGKIRDNIDVKLIMAFFTALINIDTHKEEIGIEYFPQILDYLAEFVMKGLTECRRVQK